MPPSSLRAMPTPCVDANSVPSALCVTALTKQPSNALCTISQPVPPRRRIAIPSTVPITMVSGRLFKRWVLSPPFDSRIMRGSRSFKRSHEAESARTRQLRPPRA